MWERREWEKWKGWRKFIVCFGNGVSTLNMVLTEGSQFGGGAGKIHVCTTGTAGKEGNSEQ